MAVVALITAQMLTKLEQTEHAPGIKLTPQANFAGLSRRRIQFDRNGFDALAVFGCQIVRNRSTVEA
jgi:hypothetical protein